MNKIPVVFTFNKNIILGAAVAIKSLLSTAESDTSYDVYVFHPDLDLKIIKDFEKIFENTCHNITFKLVLPKKFKKAPTNKKSWTDIVYYRILIPELLPNYDKIIYSDVDVLFKKDLSKVYQIDLENYDWAGVRAEINNENVINHKYFPENKNEFIHWTGFMLLNCKKMRENKFEDKAIENIDIIGKRLTFFDLDLINITSEKIKALPFEYVTLETIYAFEKLEDAPEYKFLNKIYSDEELNYAKENPSIVHYAGDLGKPWHRKKYPEDYQKYVDEIPKNLKKSTFRDFRKRMFGKK